MNNRENFKIAFFGVKPWEREIIEKEISRIDSFGIGIFEKEVHEDLEIAKEYDVISTFIYSKMDKKVLEKLPKLKMIASRSTGIDHIDVEEAKSRGIKVENVPVYGSETVAEYAMALLLAVAKKIVCGHQAVEENYFSPEGLTGVDLAGKTMGVIGVGKIGQNMIRFARGFRMKVLGVDGHRVPGLEKKMGFKYADLEKCLKESDFVSLHVPSIPETFHLINKENIKLMKRGCILINTSRGTVVEAEAIVWALNKGILAGAGLDVVEEEGLLIDNGEGVLANGVTKDDLREMVSYHLLRDRDDVVLTPHNAFNTREAIGRIVETTVGSIVDFCKVSVI
ncbi:MAG: NAD(P)-dependent oxidoreductase [Patescibacteria group bacterium]|jgi:D-lactate dehydrogenase